MNPGAAVIVNLLGGIALLLWGVRMVRTGVMRAWGDRLRNFIEHRAGNRFSAFVAGGIATAILGSGTAMTLIVAGLASAGAINTALGLAVLLGADLGSAIVAAIFASGSNLALWASPILLAVGYVVHAWSSELRPHNMGRILIGLGLMLLSLTLIKQASAPLSTATLFHQVLEAVGREPVLAFVIGAVLTWAFHSSLANVLLETVRMTELLERMFDTALDSLRSGSISGLQELKPMDERLNTYQTQLQAYLAELAREQLTPEESRRALELTLYISNLEHAGDPARMHKDAERGNWY